MAHTHNRMENETRQKRVAAIHDISGFGKCSLTVALPILSAAGIEAVALPTAVLSTHTGGFSGFTYRDLTGDIQPFTEHWKSLGLHFDAIYSGFLGSFEQLDLIGKFFDAFKQDDNLILVDPVMADNGELYTLFTPDFVAGMAELCKKADMLIPNITEAAFLLGETYREGPYTKAYIENLLTGLASFGAKKIVLSGVFFDDKELGAATYDKETGAIDYVLETRIPGYYHGTGDIFGSALLSGLLNGFDLCNSARIAVRFTTASIAKTAKAQTDTRFGVDFERSIPGFLKDLKLL